MPGRRGTRVTAEGAQLRAGLAVLLLACLAGCAEPGVQRLGAAPQACRAVDGDTLACGAARVRVVGLDAPEMRGECGAERALARRARARLDELARGGLRLSQTGTDRYNRPLAVVRDAEGRDVARVLIGEGLARPYDGRGRRRGWCDGAGLHPGMAPGTAGTGRQAASVAGGARTNFSTPLLIAAPGAKSRLAPT